MISTSSKPHEYCCCAIPLLNFGIYTTIIEQLTLGVLVGTLSIATPALVGTSLPSFAPWVLAIVCYVAAGVQFIGLIGVHKENLKLYRTYSFINSFAVCIAFGIAAAFIGVSASRHTKAESSCQSNFFKNGNNSTQTESQTLCNIFTWVGVGLMGGLWVVLGFFQAYLLLVVRFYGSAQSQDHKRYFSEYNVDGGGDAMRMADRPGQDEWDARPSNETLRGNEPDTGLAAAAEPTGYAHVRNLSTASSAMMNENEPYVQPNQTASYPPRHSRTFSGDDYENAGQPNEYHDPYRTQANQGQQGGTPDNGTVYTGAPTYHTQFSPQR